MSYKVFKVSDIICLEGLALYLRFQYNNLKLYLMKSVIVLR